jgi:hypothetical protein
MSKQLALYGFVRRRDGLRIRPEGVDRGKCSLFYSGTDSAAVVSWVKDKEFEPNPVDMMRHEEVVQQIFDKQVILPAKFPKIITVEALERSMEEMQGDLKKVLQRIVYKNEYHIRVIMTEPAAEETSIGKYNEMSKYIMENSSRYQYKHYFPLLTKEAKEAEFVDYAETIVRHISHKLCIETTYWRGKSFLSEKVLLDSYFWVRKHKHEIFQNCVKELKAFYPNLKFSVLGPNAPFNFVQLEFVENL